MEGAQVIFASGENNCAHTHARRMRRARKWWNIFVSNSTIRRERAKGIVCVWLYINLRCTMGETIYSTCENGARLPDYHISTIKPANIVNFDTKALDKRLSTWKSTPRRQILCARPSTISEHYFCSICSTLAANSEGEKPRDHFSHLPKKRLIHIPRQCPSPSAMIFLRYATRSLPMHSTLHNSPKRRVLSTLWVKL